MINRKINSELIRHDFPFLQNKLIYFDTAATSQKPYQVINALSEFYKYSYASVHRGIYGLAERATELYESARSTIARFIGAYADEIIFTKGATEGINIIAHSLKFEEGDEIVITQLEHHANMVPWIRLAQKHNLVLKYIPVTPDGILDYDYYCTLLTDKTKLVSFVHCSNVLGTYNDVCAIVREAKKVGSYVLLDAAQSVGHRKVNAHDLGVDFLVFSGHKVLGPTGIGVLYSARHTQKDLEPYQTGGSMVLDVDFYNAVWRQGPYKFEAGTPPIAQAIGLAQAFEYLDNTISFEALQEYEASLCAFLLNGLQAIPQVYILGPQEQLAREGHMVSFGIKNIHAHDVAAYLDGYAICVRAGHHCAQPLHTRLGINSSVRVSFYLYNTLEEVVLLLDALRKLLSYYTI